MASSSLKVECVGLSDELAAVLVPLSESAGLALGLGEDFSCLRIYGDDLPGDDDAWYRLEAPVSAGDLPVLSLFCHPKCFGSTARQRDTVRPAPQIWEQSPPPHGQAAGGPGDYSKDRAGIFLHHHLLTARDVVRGEVVGRNIPSAVAEAFAEAWAVNVDGRLARWSFPGYPVAERRGRFARIFSLAGILLPDHWQVFQSLWDGALADQKDVLEVVKRLPGL
jgi:hypothetical protein